MSYDLFTGLFIRFTIPVSQCCKKTTIPVYAVSQFYDTGVVGLYFIHILLKNPLTDFIKHSSMIYAFCHIDSISILFCRIMAEFFPGS